MPGPMIYHDGRSRVAAAIRQVGQLLEPHVSLRMRALPDPPGHFYLLVTESQLRTVVPRSAAERAIACFRARTGIRSALLFVGSAELARHDRWTHRLGGITDLIRIPAYARGLSNQDLFVATADAITEYLTVLLHDLKYADTGDKVRTLIGQWESIRRAATDTPVPSEDQEQVERLGDLLRRGDRVGAAAAIRTLLDCARAVSREEGERV